MEKESLFLSYVRLTLKKWVGFQAAIEDGMGGPYAKEKELWLGNEIEKYFKSYEGVTPGDIEDYLGQMIENEFDTLFEDGSLLQVSKDFCKAYELSIVDPNSSIFNEALKRLNSVSSSCSKKSVQNEEVTTEKSISKDMEQLAVNGADDDGEEWIVVTRKGHKK